MHKQLIPFKKPILTARICVIFADVIIFAWLSLLDRLMENLMQFKRYLINGGEHKIEAVKFSLQWKR